MRDKLRRRYQVHKEVGRHGYFEGDIAVPELTRLTELLHPEQADAGPRTIAVRFEFLTNEFDVPVITGRIETELLLECQRCLQPLEMPVSLDFSLMVDASDETLRMSDVETLYSDGGYVDINEVVEDELILALPLVALHQDTACNEHWQVSATAEIAEKENPFSVLQQLKTTD